MRTKLIKSQVQMNKYKMKFIATAMMSKLFSACHSNASIGSSNDTDTLRADGQWQEVEATDISENAVKLFPRIGWHWPPATRKR